MNTADGRELVTGQLVFAARSNLPGVPRGSLGTVVELSDSKVVVDWGYTTRMVTRRMATSAGWRLEIQEMPVGIQWMRNLELTAVREVPGGVGRTRS